MDASHVLASCWGLLPWKLRRLATLLAIPILLCVDILAHILRLSSFNMLNISSAERAAAGSLFCFALWRLYISYSQDGFVVVVVVVVVVQDALSSLHEDVLPSNVTKVTFDLVLAPSVTQALLNIVKTAAALCVAAGVCVGVLIIKAATVVAAHPIASLILVWLAL